MDRLIQLKAATPPLLITLALLCSGLLPRAQGVVPPPDGGYPNFTTAEGQNALFSLTTGAANTAVGWYSLFSNTDGAFNTGVGAGTLLFNTADQNTAFGAAALLFNTFGINNTAVGAAALLNNTGGPVDTANGGPGSGNTAVGAMALINNTNGSFNTANGYAALEGNSTGAFNTAIGFGALSNSTTGDGNIAIGSSAGINVTTGNNNIYIGNEGAASDSDTIRIGNASHARILIPAINNIAIGAGDAVFINSTTGLLGTMPSSLRFKQNIKPMDKSSEAILELTPITFCYKKDIDPEGIPQFGLLAEDVEKVNSKLVVRDKEGKAHSVRYEAVNAMLLNEFLKEHKTVQEQGATITQQRKDFEAALALQQKQIEALTAGLQKVSAQLEVSKRAPQVVNNP